MFDLSGKVALVTGGASGIGLIIAKELLRNGIKACTLADINVDVGNEAVEEINQEFGAHKAIFVKTDVVDKLQFEAAFKATIDNFQNVDILINNAGILNDTIWERELQVNIIGVVNGIVLGLENYLQNFRSGKEGVILNVGSVCGINAISCFPVYSATKFALVGLGRSFGAHHHYTRTNVKVLTICPGVTDTTLINLVSKTLGHAYSVIADSDIRRAQHQSPKSVAEAASQVIKEATSGSVWVVEGAALPYELSFPSRSERRKK